MKKKLFSAVIIAYILVMLFGTVAAAYEPYQTYTYSAEGEGMWSPAVYTATLNVDSQYMGLSDPIVTVRDIFAAPNGDVYLVDYSKSRVIVLNQYYKFKYEIKTFDSSVKKGDTFSSPEGIFVTDEYVYVCDTGNKRLVMFDLSGNYVKIISQPESALFGEETGFSPVSCAVDQYGRIFVVSSLCNKGVIVMDEESNFSGFIGAQKVTYNIFEIFLRQFMSAEQIQNSGNVYVPINFRSIEVNEEGFLFVTTTTLNETDQTAAIESKDPKYSPIKMINSKGVEVMKRNGFFDPQGEVNIYLGDKPSDLGDVACGPAGSWSIIDLNRNKTYTYDSNGVLLFAFGDSGNQLGSISDIQALDYQGSNLLIADYGGSFTMYTRTSYGDRLISALQNEVDREFSKAIEDWKEVLKWNNNFDAAYIGVGKAYYREGEYETAMEYLRSAYETEYYSNSYAEIRKEWIGRFGWVIPVVVIAVVFGFVKWLQYAAKLNYKTSLKVGKKSYWEELVYAVHLCFHPFDAFWDLKHEKRGSVRAGLTFLAITILAFYYQVIGRGYIFNPTDSYSSFFIQIISVAVPVMLWVVANWCLTTLFDGEGSFRDVFVATTYSLAPLPIFLILSTLLSNILTLNEGTLVTLLVSLGYIWVGFLLFFGMLVTHNFSLGKNIVMTLATIVSMCVIMFMAILFSSLVGKMVIFVYNIAQELSFR